MIEKKHNIKVDGMTCTNCAKSVERIITNEGGTDINVSFTTGEAYFKLDSNLDKLKTSISKSGFTVIENEIEQKYSKIEKLFLFSLVFTTPLFFHMFVGEDSFLNNKWLQMGLTIPVILTGGVHFIKSGIQSLKLGIPNMDVLVSVGVLSAFFYSVYGTFFMPIEVQHDFLFFETAASIITLVLLGNVLESRAIKKTTSALGNLQNMRPKTARKITEGVKIEKINVWDLKKDDFIQINSGDTIPIDGIIVSGELELDESMMTGESEPVYRKTLTNVISGTTAISGSAMVRVGSLYGESTIDQIIDLVKNAQQNKPSIQKFGDKVSSIFVPVVITASTLTFLLGYFIFDLGLQAAMMQSIAVLVVSCPCAMGLAAPTAIMVGIGKSAANGVLIKGGNTLEKLAKANLVVFDKTGTLTTGKFILKKLNYYMESEERIKQVILALEQNSAHPIAESLVEILSKKVGPIYMHDVIEIKGRGIKGTDMEGNTYQLVSNQHAQTITTRELHSDLILFKGTSVVAELWISDEVKEDAEETITWLKTHGFRTMLLSGDRRKNCEEISRDLFLDDYYFEKSPKEKLIIVQKLIKDHNVIMVGDGINDAPSLSTAHVGVSFGVATDIAINASEVVLIDKRLEALKTAIIVGRQTNRTIIQNFFWAFLYNTLAIPFAAFGFLTPIIAALIMAFSDIIVIGNSILLKFKRT
jgi:Cu+-exporting ATPase